MALPRYSTETCNDKTNEVVEIEKRKWAAYREQRKFEKEYEENKARAEREKEE